MKVLIIAKDKVNNYEEALRSVGVEPFVSNSFVSAEGFDGLLVPGGADIDPSFYGQTMNGSDPFDREFDELEFKEIDEFFKAGKAIFGTCRGLQLLNVYFGGSLIQDIPGHRLFDGRMHLIKLCEGFPEFAGLNAKVNSRHHQCIDKLGKDLSIFCYSYGGIPEGFVHKNKKVFGVQWHPEIMMNQGGAFIYEYFKSTLEK